ncbi:MAG: class I SAM-dependent methyltransferase [Eubacteriales bacterium]
MLTKEIQTYWTHRADGYSKVNQDELQCQQKATWLRAIETRIGPQDKSRCKVLDIGTGPGFFAILMAESGYNVTAVDFTQAMLDEAQGNAKGLPIDFQIMDAQNLTFPDDTFDVIITRNVTWNLPDPQVAYSQWVRVLKPGGHLLNFDANWYSYLDDQDKRESYEADRQRASQEEVEDFYDGTDIEEMERIASLLPLSPVTRPQWDRGVLEALDVGTLTIDEAVWDEVWSPEEKINYTTTPMFLVWVQK